MHHLKTRHEVYSPIYNEWLDTKALYVAPTMEAKDVTMHVLERSPCEDPKYLLFLLIYSSCWLVGLITNSCRTVIRLGTIKQIIFCSLLARSNTIFQGDKIAYANVCIYVCMYIYIYVCVCVCIYVCVLVIFVYVCMYIYKEIFFKVLIISQHNRKLIQLHTYSRIQIK